MNGQLSRRNLLGLGACSAASLVIPSLAQAQDEQTQNYLTLAWKDGQYVLPPLPYPFDALAPAIEKETMQIHHGKHHAGYVKGLNSTLQELEKARQTQDFKAIKALSRNLAFNGSGHVLHCLFWMSMTPNKSEIPMFLADQMKKDFGSVEIAKSQFAAATKAVEGSGWGILAFEPIAGQLIILQSEKHQNLTVWNTVPLLVCDVWEHAYYLQYANKRSDWVDNFMEIANWDYAAHRLKNAKMKLKLTGG